MAFWDDLGGFLFGSDPSFEKLSTKTPEQERALQGYFNNPIQNNGTYQAGNDWIQKILSNDPSAYAAYEAPLMQQFQQQIIPQIAERFGGLAGNAGSSALNNSLAQAGKDLSTNIGGIRAGLQQNAVNQGLQYAQQPYQNTLAGVGLNTFENVQTPGQEGFAAPLLGAIGTAAAGPLGGAFGNFAGSALFGKSNLPKNQPQRQAGW
jgi:hypothetical protein